VQTIRQIRVIQRLCQASLSIAALTIGVFVTAILGLHHLSTISGHILEGVFLACAVMGGVLLLVIRRLRCPVCHNVFVGKREPTLFTPICRHCGRRSGDRG
jgi:hypothetical protein